jgi:putative transcriptional regulator
MAIVVNVDVMLARRKMRLNTLAELVGITAQNLSVLKTGRAKAIRFSTLERLCEVLECEPGDLLAYAKGPGMVVEEANSVEIEAGAEELVQESRGLGGGNWVD